jgi:7,8-dihydropterin-6-yl-methyl-4-(beta-D-ribofuranosyl)aminobenzene 5'-phosphate synthase
MSVVVEAKSGLLLLCGCCHAGLLNTLSHVRRAFQRPVVAVAGGTHLVTASPEDLRRVSEVVVGLESVRRIYLNHCSGTAAFHELLLTLGPGIIRPCPAGTRLDFEETWEVSE